MLVSVVVCAVANAETPSDTAAFNAVFGGSCRSELSMCPGCYMDGLSQGVICNVTTIPAYKEIDLNMLLPSNLVGLNLIGLSSPDRTDEFSIILSSGEWPYFLQHLRIESATGSGTPSTNPILVPTYVINAFAAHYSSTTLYLCNARTNHQDESGTLPLVLAPRSGHMYSNIFKGYEDDGVPAAQLVTFLNIIWGDVHTCDAPHVGLLPETLSCRTMSRIPFDGSACLLLNETDIAFYLVQSINMPPISTQMTGDKVITISFPFIARGSIPLGSLPNSVMGNIPLFTGLIFRFMGLSPAVHVITGDSIDLTSLGGFELIYSEEEDPLVPVSPLSFQPPKDSSAPLSLKVFKGTPEGEGSSGTAVVVVSTLVISGPPMLIKYPMVISEDVHLTLLRTNGIPISFYIDDWNTVITVRDITDVGELIGMCHTSMEKTAQLYVSSSTSQSNDLPVLSIRYNTRITIPGAMGLSSPKCDFLTMTCKENCESITAPQAPPSLQSVGAIPLSANVAPHTLQRPFETAGSTTSSGSLAAVENPITYPNTLQNRTFMLIDGTHPIWVVLYPNGTMLASNITDGVTRVILPSSSSNSDFITTSLPVGITVVDVSSLPPKSNALLTFPDVPNTVFRTVPSSGEVFQFGVYIDTAVWQYTAVLVSTRMFGGDIVALDATRMGGGGTTALAVATTTSLSINGVYTHFYNCSTGGLCNVSSVVFNGLGGSVYVIDATNIWLAGSTLNRTAKSITAPAPFLRPINRPFTSNMFAVVHAPSVVPGNAPLVFEVYTSPSLSWNSSMSVSIPMGLDSALAGMAPTTPRPDSVVLIPDVLMRPSLVFDAAISSQESAPFVARPVGRARIDASRRLALFAEEVNCASIGYANNTNLYIESLDVPMMTATTAPSSPYVVTDYSDISKMGYSEGLNVWWLNGSARTNPEVPYTATYMSVHSQMRMVYLFKSEDNVYEATINSDNETSFKINIVDNPNVDVYAPITNARHLHVAQAGWSPSQFMLLTVSHLPNTSLLLTIQTPSATIHIGLDDGRIPSTAFDGTIYATVHQPSGNVIVLYFDMADQKVLIKVIDPNTKYVVGERSLLQLDEWNMGMNESIPNPHAMTQVSSSNRWADPLKEDYLFQRGSDGALFILSTERNIFTVLLEGRDGSTVGGWDEYLVSTTRGSQIPHHLATIRASSIPGFNQLSGDNALMIRQSDVLYRLTCPFRPYLDMPLGSNLANSPTVADAADAVLSATLNSMSSFGAYPTPQSCKSHMDGEKWIYTPDGTPAAGLLQPLGIPRRDVYGPQRFLTTSGKILRITTINGAAVAYSISAPDFTSDIEEVLQFQTGAGLRFAILLASGDFYILDYNEREYDAASEITGTFGVANKITIPSTTIPTTPIPTGANKHIAYSTVDNVVHISTDDTLDLLDIVTLTTTSLTDTFRILGHVGTLGTLRYLGGLPEFVAADSSFYSTKTATTLCTPCSAPQLFTPSLTAPNRKAVGNIADAILICKCSGSPSFIRGYHISINMDKKHIYVNELPPDVGGDQRAMTWDPATGGAISVTSNGSMVYRRCGGIPHVHITPMLAGSTQSTECSCFADSSVADRSEAACGGKAGFPATLGGNYSAQMGTLLEAPISGLRVFASPATEACIVRLDMLDDINGNTAITGIRYDGSTTSLTVNIPFKTALFLFADASGSTFVATATSTDTSPTARTAPRTFLIVIPCVGINITTTDISGLLPSTVTEHVCDLDPRTRTWYNLGSCDASVGENKLVVHRVKFTFTGSSLLPPILQVTSVPVPLLEGPCTAAAKATSVLVLEDATTDDITFIAVLANSVIRGTTRGSVATDPLLGPLVGKLATTGTSIQRYTPLLSDGGNAVMSFVITYFTPDNTTEQLRYDVTRTGTAPPTVIPIDYATIEPAWRAVSTTSFVEVGISAVPTLVVSPIIPSSSSPIQSANIPLCAECFMFSDTTPFTGIKRHLLFGTHAQRLWLHRNVSGSRLVMEVIDPQEIQNYVPAGFYMSAMFTATVEIGAVTPLQKANTAAISFLYTVGMDVYKVSVTKQHVLNTTWLGKLTAPATPPLPVASMVKRITLSGNSTSGRWQIVFWFDKGGKVLLYEHTTFEWTIWFIAALRVDQRGNFTALDEVTAGAMFNVPFLATDTGSLVAADGSVGYVPPPGIKVVDFIATRLVDSQQIFAVLINTGEILLVSNNTLPKVIGGKRVQGGVFERSRLVYVHSVQDSPSSSPLPFAISLPTNTGNPTSSPTAFVHCISEKIWLSKTPNIIIVSEQKESNTLSPLSCTDTFNITTGTPIDFGNQNSTSAAVDKVLGVDASGTHAVLLHPSGLVTYNGSVLVNLSKYGEGDGDYRIDNGEDWEWHDLYPIVMAGDYLFYLDTEPRPNSNKVRLLAVRLPQGQPGGAPTVPSVKIDGNYTFGRSTNNHSVLLPTEFAISAIRSNVKVSYREGYPFHVAIGDRAGTLGLRMLKISLFDVGTGLTTPTSFNVVPDSTKSSFATTDPFTSASAELLSYPVRRTLSSTTVGNITSIAFINRLTTKGGAPNADSNLYLTVCSTIGLASINAASFEVLWFYDILKEPLLLSDRLNMFYTSNENTRNTADAIYGTLIPDFKKSESLLYSFVSNMSGYFGYASVIDNVRQLAGSPNGAIYPVLDGNIDPTYEYLFVPSRLQCHPPNPLYPFLAQASLLRPYYFPMYAPVTEWLGCTVGHDTKIKCDFSTVVGGNLNLSAIPPTLNFSSLYIGSSFDKTQHPVTLGPNTLNVQFSVDSLKITDSTFKAGAVLFSPTSVVPATTTVQYTTFENGAGINISAYNDPLTTVNTSIYVTSTPSTTSCPVLYGHIDASTRTKLTRSYSIVCSTSHFQLLCGPNTTAATLPSVTFYSNWSKTIVTIGPESDREPCSCVYGTMVNLTDAPLCGGTPSRTHTITAPQRDPTRSISYRNETTPNSTTTPNATTPTTTTPNTTATMPTTNTTTPPPTTQTPPFNCKSTALVYQFVGGSSGSVDNATDGVTGSSTFSKRTVSDLAKGEVTFEVYADVEASLSALFAANGVSGPSPSHRYHIDAGDELKLEGVLALRASPTRTAVSVSSEGTAIVRVAAGLRPVPVDLVRRAMKLTANTTSDDPPAMAWVRTLRMTVAGAGSNPVTKDLELVVSMARELFECPFAAPSYTNTSGGAHRDFAAQEAPLSMTVTFAKYVSALPQALRETAQVTSVISRTGSALAAAPGAAGVVGRSMILVQLVTCEFSDYAPLDLSQSITGLGFGDPKGYYYRGGVVGNFAVIMGAVVFMFGSALVLFALGAQYRSLGFASGFIAALFRLHFPAFMIVPYMALMPGLVMCTVAALWHGNGDGTDIGIGLFGLIVSLGLPTALIAPVVRNLRCDYVEIGYFDQEDAFLSFFTGTWHWEAKEDEAGEPIDDTFKTRMGIVFKDYVQRAWWFMTVEVGLTYIAAILDGVRPGTQAGCIAVAWAFLVVNVIMLALVLGMRPFISVYENIFSVGANAVVAFGCAFLVVSMHINDEDQSANVGAVAEMLGLVGTFMALGKAGIDIVVNGYIQFRDTVRRNTAIDAAKYVDVTDSRQAKTLTKRDLKNVEPGIIVAVAGVEPSPRTTIDEHNQPLLVEVTTGSADSFLGDGYSEEMKNRRASIDTLKMAETESQGSLANSFSSDLGFLEGSSEEKSFSGESEKILRPPTNEQAQPTMSDDDDDLL